MTYSEFTDADGVRYRLPFTSARQRREFERRRALPSPAVTLLKARDRLEAARGFVEDCNRDVWAARRARRSPETGSCSSSLNEEGRAGFLECASPPR